MVLKIFLDSVFLAKQQPKHLIANSSVNYCSIPPKRAMSFLKQITTYGQHCGR